MVVVNRKALLISSGQPSANPRLVKEAVALYNAGYQVKVIYCPLSVWADKFDEELFKQYPSISWKKVGHHPVRQPLLYTCCRIRQKFYHWLYNTAGNRCGAAIKSMTIFSQELGKEAISQGADLYIGHNLGALPAVCKAAKKFSAKAGFDFEDFHRGEDQEGSEHWIKTKLVEDGFVTQLNYATTASPLITDAYRKLYPGLSIQTINNCFPLQYALPVLKELPSDSLKLFWFSQTVGKNRGIETVIAAAGKVRTKKVSIALLGNCSEHTKSYFKEIAENSGLQDEQLQFLGPVEESKLTAVAANYHIGIASEIPHILNRELCLTNKLFLYLLAGNAILYSDTKAQRRFLEDYPGTGVLYEQENSEQIAFLLEQYIQQPNLLEKHRLRSLQTGKTMLNWDKEQQVLLKHIEQHFSTT